MDFLTNKGVIISRTNSLPIPVVRMGVHAGFRPGSRAGRPDLEGILPPRGRALCIEIKTGKDRLSDIQKAYLDQCSKAGALVLVVKDFDDFFAQWNNLST